MNFGGFATALAGLLSLASCASPVRAPSVPEVRQIGRDALVSWQNHSPESALTLEVRCGDETERFSIPRHANHFLVENVSFREDYSFTLEGAGFSGVSRDSVRFQGDAIRYPAAEDLNFPSRHDFRVLYTFASDIPLQAADLRFSSQPGTLDVRQVFENTARDALDLFFAQATRVEPEEYRRIEKHRSLLVGVDMLGSNPLYGAPTLVEVDFRPPRRGVSPALASQLVMRVYDISATDPMLPDQEPYWNVRPLIFEDYQELCSAEADLGEPEDFPRRLLHAWQRLLSRLEADTRFRTYAQVASVDQPLSEQNDQAVLGLRGVVPESLKEKSRAGSTVTHRWVTDHILFPGQQASVSESPERPGPRPKGRKKKEKDGVDRKGDGKSDPSFVPTSSPSVRVVEPTVPDRDDPPTAPDQEPAGPPD